MKIMHVGTRHINKSSGLSSSLLYRNSRSFRSSTALLIGFRLNAICYCITCGSNEFLGSCTSFKNYFIPFIISFPIHPAGRSIIYLFCDRVGRFNEKNCTYPAYTYRVNMFLFLSKTTQACAYFS